MSVGKRKQGVRGGAYIHRLVDNDLHDFIREADPIEKPVTHLAGLQRSIHNLAVRECSEYGD